jgi:hypothetical protein
MHVLLTHMYIYRYSSTYVCTYCRFVRSTWDARGMCGCVILLWGISACPTHPSGRGALCKLGGGVNPEGVAPYCGGHGASKYHFALSLPT